MFAGIRKLWGGVKTAPEKDVITILYGSKSGNAEFVASEAFRHLKDLGQKASLKSLSSYKAEYLKEESMVLFVVSTHGEGDPPPAAARFFKQLFKLDEDLSGLSFSVCALGDSDYDDFCKAGRDLDDRLLELGAKHFSRRVDCDEAFETEASGWISEVAQVLTKSENQEALCMQKHEREWFFGSIKEKRRLNQGGDDVVFHIAMTLDSQHIYYRSGDSVGILPQNPSILVDQIIGALKLSPTDLVDVEANLFLREFLLSKVELTNLNRPMLERYQQVSGDENLADLLRETQTCKDYVETHDFLDLLNDFPYAFRAAQLTELLDPLRVRYYSIASFQPRTPNEIHLTVKQVRFHQKDRLRRGVCSSYLSEWLEVGTPVSFFIAPDEEFRLPADPAIPAIFIAAGTGIAPVRAFLAEREVCSESKNWLFFGAKNRTTDFLYQDELENWKTKGTLERLDLAFSRDQATKVYVQDLLLRRGEELLQWIESGAYIYVCGSVAMGRSVCSVLDTLLKARSPESSVNNLIEENRYCEDVY